MGAKMEMLSLLFSVVAFKYNRSIERRVKWSEEKGKSFLSLLILGGKVGGKRE